MDTTPWASTKEPGSGNGNNTKGTGVPTRQQIHWLHRRIFQLFVVRVNMPKRRRIATIIEALQIFIDLPASVKNRVQYFMIVGPSGVPIQ